MSFTVPKVPLGEVPTPESGVGIKTGTSTGVYLRDVAINSSNQKYFIRPGHVVQMAYYGAALHPGEVQKANAEDAGVMMVLGVAITHSNVYPGQSAYINNTDITFHAPDSGRVTYISQGVAYVRVDPTAATTIAAGKVLEVTDFTDATDTAVCSAEYRYGTVSDGTDTDSFSIRVGWSLEAEQTYIPFNPESWDAQVDGTSTTAGTGIPVVKCLIDINHTPTTIS